MVVLVGYASEHGSTRGIAEHIATRLVDSGLQAEARALGEGVNAADYEAFVLGSAVHNGAWLTPAADFVRHNTRVLADRPVWLFSAGLARVVGGWAERRGQQPRPVGELQQSLRPRGHHLFAGAFYRDHTSIVGHVVYRAMRGRYGDHRNWPEIDTWAEGIARALGPDPKF